MTHDDKSASSPFHAGERRIQARMGVRDETEALGRRLIRAALNTEHARFFESLPFVVLGMVDADGWPWATLAAGYPGFVQAEAPKRLTIANAHRPGDPACRTLEPGAPVGVLGIELETRRRARVNGRISAGGDTLQIDVDQAFGNCPKYIQRREHTFVRDPVKPTVPPVEDLPDLDAEARATIAQADTFFIASLGPPARPDSGSSADVSHRGGRPGFVRVDDARTLTVPDYPGNNFFNTLGNLAVDGRAALLLVDFASGDLLQLTGIAEIVWKGPEVDAFPGAERAWRFRLDRAVRQRDAVPLRWRFRDHAPTTLATGTWADVTSEWDSWQTYRIARIDDESETVRSFYLEPADGDPLPDFRAGQHLPVRLYPEDSNTPVVRSYTLSMAPADRALRISVKREPQGVASIILHDHLREGSLVEGGRPSGAFTIAPRAQRPAVLLSAGIGATPMIAMLRQIVAEGLAKGAVRPVWYVHGDRKGRVRPFYTEVRAVAALSSAVRTHFALSRPETPWDGFDSHGHVTPELLQRLLPFGAYEVYLCGPPGFMQAMYDGLRELDVPDARIFAESFGPAALRRTGDGHGDTGEQAQRARVRFAAERPAVTWTPEQGTLLDLAEASGLAPAFQCRQGTCGTCATPLHQGSVSYTRQPSAPVPPGHVLTCCAVPRAGDCASVPELVLALDRANG